MLVTQVKTSSRTIRGFNNSRYARGDPPTWKPLRIESIIRASFQLLRSAPIDMFDDRYHDE